MSTRNRPLAASQSHSLTPAARAGADPTELVALVIAAKRPILLRAHRHRLRHDDLEECFAQASLELIDFARRGARFANRIHIARTLEQRFVSRIHDRSRALGGRSAKHAQLEQALSGVFDTSGHEAPDPRADVERLAAARAQLSLLLAGASALTADQRLVLATQTALEMDCAEFCERFGWTREKYRKVAQRARARLLELMHAT